ncbi:MAG TPA: hypothetical protein VNC62_15810 [Burkholderiales bacterium]|jgi:uncharacterized membrane protein (UPF0136 family)|nr:hypothetical protein [Burkholderiales bacterium]
MSDFGEALVWTVRLVLLAGLCWGAWLCIGPEILPAGADQGVRLERFATFALLVLLLTTLGGIVRAYAG